MRRSISALVLTILLASGVFWMACSSSSTGPDEGDNDYTAVKQFYNRLDVDGQTGLRVEAVSGTVTVKGIAGSDSVVVKGIMRVRAPSQADADARIEGLSVVVKSVQEEISAETNQPSDTEGRSYEVDYDITIPAAMAVLISSVNGTITITDVTSELTVASTNGGVVLDGFVGDATISVVNGTVVGDVTLPLGGVLTIGIVNGGAGIEIPTETSADFTARVVNGSISTSNLTFTDLETTPTMITGVLGEGDGVIDISVTNGTILVTGI